MQPKTTTSSRESRNNLYISIGAIAGVIVISGITTAALLINNRTVETSNAQKNNSSSSSYISLETNQNEIVTDDQDLLFNSLPSSQNFSIPIDNNKSVLSATSLISNLNTPNQNNQSSTSLSSNQNNQSSTSVFASQQNNQSSTSTFISNQIPGTATINPNTVTKQEYKEITGQDAPTVEVKKDPQATVTEKTITFTYSNAGDADMTQAVLTINLASELKVKPGSMTDTIGGQTYQLSDTLINNNRLSFGPGTGINSTGQVKIGQKGQGKITLLISSEVQPGSYRISSTLKDQNDNRELVNTPSIYFVEVS